MLLVQGIRRLYDLIQLRMSQQNTIMLTFRNIEVTIPSREKRNYLNGKDQAG
jgi:hypothetical protein